MKATESTPLSPVREESETSSRGVAPHEEQHTPKVQNVERLCDFVFVIALNVCASDLEVSESLLPGLPLFALRVFLMWSMWHMGAVLVNLSTGLANDGRELGSADYLVMYVLMGCQIFMARAVAERDDFAFCSYYLGTRAIQAGYAMVRIYFRARPSHVTDAHYNLARLAAVFHLVMVTLAEAAPLGIALALHVLPTTDEEWLPDDDPTARRLAAEATAHELALPHVLSAPGAVGGAPGGEGGASATEAGELASTLYSPEELIHLNVPTQLGLLLWAIVPVLVWTFRFVAALTTDLLQQQATQGASSSDIRATLDAKSKAAAPPGGGRFISVLNTAHMIERYELIVLIFIGEMVFAAALAGPWLLSLSTIGVLISTFTLYFRCRPRHVTLPWDISYTREMLESFTHMLLFCALGALGAAWAAAIRLEHARHLTHLGRNAPHAPPLGAANATAGHPALVQMAAPGRMRAWHLTASTRLSAAAVEATPNMAAVNALIGEPTFDEQACFAMHLLTLSAGSFLALTGLSTLMSRDPIGDEQPRLPKSARFAWRVAAAAVIGALNLLETCQPIKRVCYAIPCIMGVSALVELWGVRPE